VRLLSGDYLFSSPVGEPSMYFTVLTVALGVLFVASAVIYWRRGKIASDNPILKRLLRRATKTFMWLAAIGLFLAAMRYVQFDYIDIPFLMLLDLVGIILAAGYFVYDLSERYPLALHRFRESHIERRYRPAPSRRAEPIRVRTSNLRGKRRR
jgi:hypothetical protein